MAVFSLVRQMSQEFFLRADVLISEGLSADLRVLGMPGLIAGLVDISKMV